MEKEKCLKCKHYSRTKKRCNKTMKYATLVTSNECVLKVVKVYENNFTWIDGEPIT